MCKRYLLYLKEKKNIAMFPKFQNYFEEDEFYYTIRKEAFITFKNLPLKGEREKHFEEEEDTESSPHART